MPTGDNVKIQDSGKMCSKETRSLDNIDCTFCPTYSKVCALESYLKVKVFKLDWEFKCSLRLKCFQQDLLPPTQPGWQKRCPA